MIPSYSSVAECRGSWVLGERSWVVGSGERSWVVGSGERSWVVNVGRGCGCGQGVGKCRG